MWFQPFEEQLSRSWSPHYCKLLISLNGRRLQTRSSLWAECWNVTIFWNAFFFDNIWLTGKDFRSFAQIHLHSLTTVLTLQIEPHVVLGAPWGSLPRSESTTTSGFTVCDPRCTPASVRCYGGHVALVKFCFIHDLQGLQKARASPFFWFSTAPLW